MTILETYNKMKKGIITILIIIILFFTGYIVYKNKISKEKLYTNETKNKMVDKISQENQDIYKNTKYYTLPENLKAEVKDHTIIIYDSNGKEISSNDNIIKLTDDFKDCPADGFEGGGIVTKEKYFTIEQQVCGGWYLIKEYITFVYNKESGDILLNKFGRIYTDRRDPNKTIPDKILSQKDFGNIDFKDLNLLDLYKIISKN